MSELCRTCQRNELTDEYQRARGVCDPCASQLGVVAMPPPHRPPLPCQRCAGRQLIRAIPRELTVDADQYTLKGQGAPRNGPTFVTYEVTADDRFFGKGRTVHDVGPTLGRGPLELYVCRTCGFVEQWCLAPGEIPIGPQYMTEAVEVPEPEPPYR